ncbi:dihydrofolate reductase-like domain-containing protein [Syncephalis plumigaleata]|nr:dihydrofolate reductase-like domain-containing protein [Syncephalis plumigaleata]
MSTIDIAEQRQTIAETFIAKYYDDNHSSSSSSRLAINQPVDRPWITLTYAQSLDGKIAGEHGQQLVLSGAASMIMTHRLRTVHDAILVELARLFMMIHVYFARHLRLHERNTASQPQPIILDTHLPPWIIVGDTIIDPVKWQQVEACGAKIIRAPLLPDTEHIDMRAAMELLHNLGIRRVMIEGGARVIQGLLAMLTPIVDLLIVTIAPVYVGEQGISVINRVIRQHKQDSSSCTKFNVLEYVPFEEDIVMAATLSS